jgi:uncharacterized protein
MGFEFQLVLTENCNLACTYCYIDQKHNHMSKETFDAHYKMLPKIMEFYGQHTYNAALFGGEPFLNWELIEYITPILKNDPKCQFIIAMTNGLVLKDDYKRDYVQKNGIALSLSFDGLWNKQNRPLKTGGSSLDEYLKEPLKSLFSGKGGCKVMIAPESVPTMVENFKWFVEEYNMNSPDFSLVRDDIWSDSDIDLFETELYKLTDVVIEYFRAGKPVMVGLLQLYILDLLFGESYGKRPFGCFAGCNGAGFMPSGMVYPCARFGSNDKYPIANSLDGDFLPHSKILRNPLITNPTTYSECKECSIYKYCNAGCTYQQLQEVDGNLTHSKPIDSICRLLHICYKQSIRIVNELKDNDLFIGMIKNSIKNVG